MCSTVFFWDRRVVKVRGARWTWGTRVKRVGGPHTAPIGSRCACDVAALSAVQSVIVLRSHVRSCKPKALVLWLKWWEWRQRSPLNCRLCWLINVVSAFSAYCFLYIVQKMVTQNNVHVLRYSWTQKGGRFICIYIISSPCLALLPPRFCGFSKLGSISASH
jgi:hypothetical protein